jgi:hypothetical protein
MMPNARRTASGLPSRVVVVDRIVPMWDAMTSRRRFLPRNPNAVACATASNLPKLNFDDE